MPFHHPSRTVPSFLFACALFALAALAACQAPPRREPILAAFAMTDIRLSEQHAFGESFTPPADFPRDAQGHLALDYTLRSWYETYADPQTSEADRLKARNRIAYTFLTLIKHYHEATTDDVYELTAAISTGFDLFSMAMGGLGAATGTSSDKALYSALAAFGVGARGSLSRNILAEQTTQAILQQMDAMRLEQEAKLRRNLKLDDTAYPLHAALTDLYDYYTAGSVKDAVAELARSAQQAKDRAKSQLNQTTQAN